MRGAVQGRDTSVRGKICKGRFVAGAQHPRTFGQGHIGRGDINPASDKGTEHILQGHFVQRTHYPPNELIVHGTERPRTFVRGHIDQGHVVIVSLRVVFGPSVFE